MRLVVLVFFFVIIFEASVSAGGRVMRPVVLATVSDAVVALDSRSRHVIEFLRNSKIGIITKI